MISNDVFLIVLLAALFNAGWNSAVKIGGDRISVMAITTLIGSAISLLALPWVQMPAPASWWLLAFSVVIHTAYHLVLPQAYRHGDLGQVYPIARGSAPLLVVVGGVVLAGEWPGTFGVLGVGVLSAGVLALSWRSQAQRTGAGGGRAVGYALLTGLLIAAYTVVDALGARLAGAAIGFAVWVTLLDGITTALVVLRWRGVRAFQVDRKTWALCALAGAMQMGAYWLVVWALARAPMGTVSALRETSVLFVALISVGVLKERLSARRMVSAVVVFLGIVLIRWGAA